MELLHNLSTKRSDIYQEAIYVYYHPWSKDVLDYTIIPEQKQSSRDIPAIPTMELLSRK